MVLTATPLHINLIEGIVPVGLAQLFAACIQSILGFGSSMIWMALAAYWFRHAAFIG
eukprot:m.334178 g.334178  ORF g.334178 m.334178 type:complete len:57 (-) comp20505_c0_seq36:3522-3692(-)